jgi:hypothetical protein
MDAQLSLESVGAVNVSSIPGAAAAQWDAAAGGLKPAGSKPGLPKPWRACRAQHRCRLKALHEHR